MNGHDLEYGFVRKDKSHTSTTNPLTNPPPYGKNVAKSGACKMSLSKPEIIQTAACPFCAAPRGKQCTFNRLADPHGFRFRAMQSHVERAALARKIAAREKKALDSISLFP